MHDVSQINGSTQEGDCHAYPRLAVMNELEVGKLRPTWWSPRVTRIVHRGGAATATLASIGLPLLAGCGRLDELLYDPLTTPAEWCERRPCVIAGDFVFNEPLGSFLVFLLAALWVAVGIRFLGTAAAQRSRWWMGIALILGGLGAAQAGISFQAFSYTLKCAGREHCLLTNFFEVGYSLTQAVSVSAMLTAVAYSSARGHLRTTLLGYSAANAIVFSVVTAAGVMLPNRMLLSFEVLMLFALPGLLMVIGMSAYDFLLSRERAARSLLIASLLLLAVQVAYFSYAAAGITASLWRDGDGFYFSENDVLHTGMIAWLWYATVALGSDLRDRVAR